MHYFKDRTQAGSEIAHVLKNLENEDCIVLGLSPGGVLVGAEIARQLHALICMLMVKDVMLPDGRTILGQVNEIGGFVHDDAFSASEIEEFEIEYHASIEQAKQQALHDMHVIMGGDNLISKDYFRNRVVIVASDGANTGAAFETASTYLKSVHVKKIVMATPMATIRAVDRMHIMADQIICLNVIESTFPVEHYYAINELPAYNGIVQLINSIILDWYKHHPEIPIPPTIVPKKSRY